MIESFSIDTTIVTSTIETVYRFNIPNHCVVRGEVLFLLILGSAATVLIAVVALFDKIFGG